MVTVLEHLTCTRAVASSIVECKHRRLKTIHSSEGLIYKGYTYFVLLLDYMYNLVKAQIYSVIIRSP